MHERRRKYEEEEEEEEERGNSVLISLAAISVSAFHRLLLVPEFLEGNGDDVSPWMSTQRPPESAQVILLHLPPAPPLPPSNRGVPGPNSTPLLPIDAAFYIR